MTEQETVDAIVASLRELEEDAFRALKPFVRGIITRIERGDWKDE